MSVGPDVSVSLALNESVIVGVMVLPGDSVGNGKKSVMTVGLKEDVSVNWPSFV